jgi:hypothetical protein
MTDSISQKLIIFGHASIVREVSEENMYGSGAPQNTLHSLYFEASEFEIYGYYDSI